MKKLLALLPLVAICLTIAFLSGGCASYSIQPIAASTLTNWCADGKPLPSGYIVYQPELYFAATITDIGQNTTVTVTPLYLPNYHKPYRITTDNFLGKADFNFQIADGWKLIQISDKSDNTTLANTLAGQLKTIIDASGIAKMGVTGTQKPRTRTLIYRPFFDERTGYFTSFTNVGAIVDTGE